MSFATSLYTLLTGDTAINAAVNEIYYQNLPDNTPITATNIVYYFDLTESIDHLAKNNELDIYNLELTIVAPDTNTIDTVLNLVRTYLDNYTSSEFRDIKAQNSGTTIEGERNQYTCTINYRIIYQALPPGD
jgi:hypothetical protein